MSFVERKLTRLRKNLLRALGKEHRVNAVMLHIGRCGSTVLANMLSARTDIHWIGEIYEPYFQEKYPNHIRSGEFPVFEGGPLEVLRKEKRLRVTDVFGFEIKPFHFELIGIPMEKFMPALIDMGFNRFVLLDRKNRLRTVISALLAAQPGNKYALRVGDEVRHSSVRVDLQAVEIEYDKKPLLDYLQGYDSYLIRLRELLESHAPLELFYEDDVEMNPKVGYQRICDYFSTSNDIDIEVSLQKINPYPLSELIVNFEEVRKYLVGTSYEWMPEG